MTRIMPQVREVIGAIATVALVASLSQPALAKRVKPMATIDVRVDAAADVAAWQASAMQTTLRRDIATDKRWTVITAGNADVVLRATLERSRIRYEVSIPSAGEDAHVTAGSLSIAGKGRTALRNDIRNVLSPMLQPGGGIGRVMRGDLPPPPGSLSVDGSTPPVNRTGVVIALLAVVLFLAVPFLLGMIMGGTPAGRLKQLRALKGTLAIWGLLAAAIVVIAADLAPATHWPIYIPAGIAWGWFVAAVAQMSFPPFRGLERIEHRDVFRLVRAWSFVAGQRLATGVLLYGPFMLAMWWTCAAIDVPAHITIGVVMPLWGMTVRFWFLSLVETIASGLDDQLVNGPADLSNEWEIAVRGYIVGYMRRAGAPVPEELLARVRFLPGKSEGITLYGGGLTHSRIVINQELLELALAPYDRPHDYAPEREHVLLFNEWTSGLVIPIDVDSRVANKQDRTPRHDLDGGEIVHDPLGQPPTLAGFVEPSAIDNRVNFRPAEDPVWLDWDPGEEHDGTDPNDKDFLFGALVRELGLIERRDDHMLTVAHAFHTWLSKRPPALGKVWTRLASKPYTLVLARYPALLADAYTALNYGRNHLVQHLAYQTWAKDDLLTARAYPPVLERQTETIFDELSRDDTPAAAHDLNHRRLVWMSWFSHARLRSRRATLARRVAFAGVGVAVAISLGLGVKRALDYHPTYKKRIEAQERATTTNGNANGEQGKQDTAR